MTSQVDKGIGAVGSRAGAPRAPAAAPPPSRLEVHLIGLTGAFQYAGARSVLASLWNVNDPATAALMERFYGYLKAGRSKDEALRSAQIDLLRGPIQVPGTGGQDVSLDASHPFYWAAFQLIGDWR